uniref:MARVEL domain-containing protein n=1 Tax=Heliothis virescens TaxID=7102 RepID=A0A2A4JIN4_HELVI
MRLELPVLKRCCLCLPLRYGLIAWGFVRLATTSFLLFDLMMTLVRYLEDKRTDLTVLVIGMLIFFTDIVLVVLFIIGGYTKNLRILKAYYTYAIILWSVTMLYGVYITVQTIDSLRKANYVSYARFLILDLVSFVLQILIQSYIILLLRSEIIKLSNNCEFRFVNNSAEVELRINDENKEKPSLQENGSGMETV